MTKTPKTKAATAAKAGLIAAPVIVSAVYAPGTSTVTVTWQPYNAQNLTGFW